MRPADLFGAYVRGLCSLSGASSVSVYEPAHTGSLAETLLSHYGELPPVPELADLESAERFRRSVAPRLYETRRTKGELTAVEIGSRAPGGRLIGVFSKRPLGVPDRRQAGRDPGDASVQDEMDAPQLWLGLRLDEERGPEPLPEPLLQPMPQADALRVIPSAWTALLRFTADLGRHSRHLAEILDDPITGLPGRAELQVGLEHALEAARQEGRPLSLLLINPDDFSALNGIVVREAADRVIREVGDRLRAAHRESDLVARYGSVVFASILIDVGETEAVRRAEQILEQLHGHEFLAGTVPLRFSLGVAAFGPDDKGIRRGFDLVQRASAALTVAKRSGGGQWVLWRDGLDAGGGYVDRLTGIFTGQAAKDYRNMAVLADTVAVVAGGSPPGALAAQVVKGLFGAIKPDKVGLFEWSKGGTAQLIYGVSRRFGAGAAFEMEESLPLGEEERQLLACARERHATVERHGEEAGEEVYALAVPLRAGGNELGALFVAGRVQSMSLDSSDDVFLEALAAQVASALDRAQLHEQQRRYEEQERKRLEAEVEELRSALGRSELLHRSPQMEALLRTARQVAPTDATVLITGESGTGKEMLARTIHELSGRRGQPFVVVDCGAIPATLIESELFGHEKGAFTGAVQRKAGRLVLADKGTLLLDEIGELPIETQSRLLRFVQEKQVMPVGGASGRVVDVRLLAATNRKLLADVESGRFRGDLYHRLNVVRIEIPALRDRPDDVLFLAGHFLERFARLYHKAVDGFSPEAVAALRRHAWPGNVRELHNRVMRAVILCAGASLNAADLGLAEPEATSPEERAERPRAEGVPQSMTPAGEVWAGLRRVLAQQIEQALFHDSRYPPPLGRWLAEDLVLEAGARASGVTSRAATLLGMPETTFRRRFEKASAEAASGRAPRPESWQTVRAELAALLRREAIDALFEASQGVLLGEILARTPERQQTRAALLGVTLATFQRRSAAFSSSSPGNTPAP